MIFRIWAGKTPGGGLSFSILGFLLALPPVSFWPAGIVGVYSLITICKKVSLLRASVSGACVGLCMAVYAYWGVHTMSWVLLALGVVFLTALFALIALVTSYSYTCFGPVGALVSSAFVSISEVLCAELGIPFSHAVFWVNSPLLDLLIPYIGAEGQAGLFWLIAHSTFGYMCALFLSCFVAFLVWLPQADSGYSDYKVGLGQTSFTEGEINFPGLPGRLERRYKVLDKLMSDAASESVDLIVLPESALPVHTSLIPLELKSILKKSEPADLLVHRYKYKGQNLLLSNNLLLDSNLKLLGESGKRAPIPIVEARLVPMSSGKNLRWRELSILAVVCSDSLRAAENRDLLRDADLMIITANDNSLAGSVLPELHLRMDQIRAAESGVVILRAVNGGPSAVIDKRGNVISKLDEGYEGILISNVPESEQSFYIKHQSYSVCISFLILVIVLFFQFKRKEKGGKVRGENIVKGSSEVVISLLLLSSFILWQHKLILQKQSSSESSNFERKLYSPELFLLRQFGFKQSEVQSLWQVFELEEQILGNYFFEEEAHAALVETVNGKILILDESDYEALIYTPSGIRTIDVEQIKSEMISDQLNFKIKIP